MAQADLLSVSANAIMSSLPGTHGGGSTWDELQRSLSQVTSDPARPLGMVSIDCRIKDLHDQGYDYAEIFVVAMQQLVHFASPREISEPFRAAISSLLVQMRATIDKSLNVR
jgi:hypothetical protein